MEKNQKNYYVGLDIGTNSSGYAVTDENYNIIKRSGKSLWGVRLFEEAKTAKERRVSRCNRRRMDRRRERIELLQSLFAEEIAKIDPEFFLRLNEAALYDGDKTVAGEYNLFNDEGYTDKEYNQEFKTIYHLEQKLLHDNKKYDIRLIYLACQHLIKYRGHFLMGNYNPADNSSNDEEIKKEFQEVCDILNSYNEETINKISFKDLDISRISEIYKNNEGSSHIEFALSSLLNSEKNKVKKSLIKLLSGGKASIPAIFGEAIDYSEIENKSFSLSDEMAEEYINAFIEIPEIGDNARVLFKLKEIYDYFLLNKLLNGEKYIADAMVQKYNTHAMDLKILKKLLKAHYPKEAYFNVFRSNKEVNNYAHYVGSNNTNSVKKTYGPSKSKEDTRAKSEVIYEQFLKYVKSVLETNPLTENDDYNYIINKINNKTLLPKIRVKDNVYIPYQLTRQELQKILDNASKHYQFLKEEDTDKISATQKIVSILQFRVPYYVGPLNENSQFAWLVRRSKEKITPWNFEKVVDFEKSSEKFIRRMTNKCTYYLGKDVLPKKSLLYSEFALLNEINNLQINGEKITAVLKNKIIEEVFKKNKKVSLNYLKKYLKHKGYEEVQLSGIDGDFKNTLSSYIDFVNILGHELSYEEIQMAEKIIFWITIFSDSSMVEKKIRAEYSNILDDSQIKKIKGLSYSGWGRLSKEFLVDLVSDPDDIGVCKSVLDVMRETNENLNEALYDRRYKLMSKLEAVNSKVDEKVTYKDVEELYCSPSVKRGVWQSIKIVDEIVKINHHEPSMIFVEVTREEEKEKKRTDSRKKSIQDIYNACKKEISEYDKLYGLLEDIDNSKLRSEKYFLYFMQLGKSMYTGKPISLDRLENYDIDHIIPQSMIKDDSISNKVLVEKIANEEKKDIYPVNPAVQLSMKNFWNMLKKIKFLDEKKYSRLTRKEPLSSDELAGFINRQLATTNQSIKAVCDLLQKKYPNTILVYSKSANVTAFRNIFSLTKCRDINDLHHAKDAYLNIVVGNVLYNKYTKYFYNLKDKIAEYKEKKETTNYMNIFFHNVENAWKAYKNESINIVKKMMSRNDIFVTKLELTTKSEFYDQTIYGKGSKDLYPIREEGKLSNITKYGGFNKVKTAYFMLIESEKKKGVLIKTIESIPVIFDRRNLSDEDFKEQVLCKYLKLKNPRILIRKIRRNSLIQINDSLLRITAKTEDNLVVMNSNQLFVNSLIEKYIKVINKFKALPKEIKDSIDDTKDSFEVSKTKNNDYILSKEKNLQLFRFYCSAFNKKMFDGISLYKSYGDRFIEKEEDFKNLSLIKQISLLQEILKFFQCKSITVNASTLLEKADVLGTIRINKNITDKNIVLINQSITGFFEKKVKL